MSGSTRLHRRLPAHPSSAGEARRLVRRALLGAGLDELVDEAVLLASEVVTNAVVHAGTPMELGVEIGDHGVRVSVADGSPHLPAVRAYGAAATTGRGLTLLETAADEWGVVRRPRGKAVWFALGHPEPSDAPPGQEPVSRPAGPTTVTVELQNLPLLLHTAWQQHAHDLLREHLLSGFTHEPVEDQLEMHAAAANAAAILAEQIPVLEVGDGPEQVMSSAVEPHVTRPLVTLRVPADAVRDFAVLDAVLSDAVAMAQRGQLLGPPTQPEIQALRHWLCGEVTAQAAGAAPIPWSLQAAGTALLPPRDSRVRDVDAVRRSSDAVIAVDDANYIVAASAAAADMLRYGSDLEGQRLLTVIPERFRQAHIAGFTLHLLTGRRPLLDRSIVVPVLRGDGTETSVELTIHAERQRSGRGLFVGVLRPVDPPDGAAAVTRTV